ncbi:MAG: FkbM family methyltransferase [Pseudanabaenaceae cyanobacterium]
MDLLSPLVVTGMHRSGTSLTASLLQTLGTDLGQTLVAADRHNRKGYFEDLDFVTLQRQLLQVACPADVGGWPDWGWTEQEQLATEGWAAYREEAQRLIAARQERGHPWGWKDPRTTLLLDFWRELLPQARYLLVYRWPWDVVDSILRLRAPVFAAHPDYPLRIWHYYNRHLLDFYRRNRHRALLVSVNGLLQSSQFLDLLESRLGVTGDRPAFDRALPQIFDPHLFGQLPGDHPLVTALPADAQELLRALDSTADVPSGWEGPVSAGADTPWLGILRWHQRAIAADGAETDRNAQYDRQTLAIAARVLQPTDNCVDVGAHTGSLLTEVLKWAPEGQHFAFEPLPDCFARLQQDFGDRPNVHLFNCALADKVGTTTFVHVVTNPAFSGLQPRRYFRGAIESQETVEEITVSVARLDEVIPAGVNIAWIKIDVEGGEYQVLLGAKKLLQRDRPYVVFEHGLGAADFYGTTPEMLWDLFTECTLAVSTLEGWLQGAEPLDREGFSRAFYSGEYYFLAYPAPIWQVLDRQVATLQQRLAHLEQQHALERQVSARLQQEIVAMASSKFWKARELWFRLKKKLKGS